MLRLLLLLCLVTAHSAAQTGLTKRTRDMFERFDKLGFADTTKAAFIRIWTGTYQEDGKRRVDETNDGFLLEDHGRTFRAVLGDLTVGIFKKDKVRGEAGFCGYEKLSLENEARRLLRELKSATYFKPWHDASVGSYEDRMERAAQIFALARACAQRGHAVLAESLVRALDRHPSRDGLSPNLGSLREELERELARSLEWQFLTSVRDGRLSWADLHARAKQLAALMPDDGYDEYARVFGQRAEEEADHARTAPKPLDALPPREKARELVWSLRDEQEDENDTWPRPWPFEPRKSNGAMARLRELGFDAVPALIGELRGGGVSRSVGRDGRWRSIWLSDTSELAGWVLNDIAGVNFHWLTDYARKEPEQKMPALIAAVEDWWRTVESKGERQWLIEMVQKGGEQGDNCAERLRQRFPGDFVETMLAGARKTTEPRDRSEFTKKLWKARDPRVDEFFREELRRGPTLGNRVAAAYGLRQRGVAEGEKVVREEWARLVQRGLKDEATWAGPKDAPGINLEEHTLSIPAEASEHALAFLASCDSTASLHALLESWPNLPLHVRRKLVERVGGRDFAESSDTLQQASGPVRTLVREILLTALGETSEARVQPDRVCDVAASLLHSHWPNSFAFDATASESVRERQRITMLNIHRREQGLAELPLPPERPKVPRTKANHVATIEWEPGSAKPSAQLAKQLAAMKDRPFRPETFVPLLAGYAGKPQPGTAGFHLAAVRDGDATGVVVRAHLAAGEVTNAASADQSELVVLDGEKLRNSYGSGMRDSFAKKSHWSDFQKAAATAAAAPPEKPFVIKARVQFPEKPSVIEMRIQPPR